MARRKTRITFLVALIIAALAFGMSQAFADIKLPQPTGYVNDFAGMLSQRTVDDINAELGAYEKKSGNEIAVATVKDLQGTTVEDFAVRLFEKWKIGKKGKDNGALLLIAKDERKVRIEVGYGLEPDLTDAQSYDIIHDVITPKLKASEYDQAVIMGVGAITTVISGGAPPTANTQPSGGIPHVKGRNFGGFIYLGFFLILGVFQWLVSVLGRTKSWWLGGALGGAAGLAVMLFSVIAGVIAMVILVPVGLLFDFVVSKAYDERQKHPNDRNNGSLIPWWAGGGWGPGGFGGGDSGGGFGGFGGGESGGGGADGDW
jgi:uncharacterized protein